MRVPNAELCQYVLIPEKPQNLAVDKKQFQLKIFFFND